MLVVGKVMNEWCMRWSQMHPGGECIILTSRCIHTFIHRLEIPMPYLLIDLEGNPQKHFTAWISFKVGEVASL